MSDDKKGGAKSEAGKLFIDIGSTGLGTLIKGLNSLSASFLLTKNAASQTSQMITQIASLSSKASESVVNWDKLNTVTGMTIGQLQDIELWAKSSNIDVKTFMNQIISMQQKLRALKLGQGDVRGLALLGLDPRELNENNPIETLNKIKDRIQSLDAVSQTYAMNQLGLSADMLYAFKQQNTEIDKRLRLNGDEIAQLKQQNSETNSLSVTWEAFQRKLIGNQKWINVLLEATKKWLVESHPYLEAMTDFLNQAAEKGFFTVLGEHFKEGVKDIWEVIKTQHNINKETVKWDGAFNDPTVARRYAEEMAKKQAEEEKRTQEYRKGYKERTGVDLNKARVGRFTDSVDAQTRELNQKVNKEMAGATSANTVASPFNATNITPSYNNTISPILPPLPSTAAGNNNNVNININQNITAPSPEEAGKKSAMNIHDDINEILERQNLAGL